MNSKDIRNNEDLYKYICWLATELRGRKEEVFADKLVVASNFACGSPSEFLHEAECVLREVKVSGIVILSDTEKKDIDVIIHKINNAFKEVGGA